MHYEAVNESATQQMRDIPESYNYKTKRYHVIPTTPDTSQFNKEECQQFLGLIKIEGPV